MDNPPAPSAGPSPAPAEPAAHAPRGLAALLVDSLSLASDSAWTCAALVALGLIPGLILEAVLLPGVTKETLKAAIAAGNFGPVAASAAVKLVDRLVRSFCGVAVIIALDLRSRGGEASLGESLTSAGALYGTYLLAVVLSSLWIVGGLVLFIIPGIILALRYVFVPMAVVIDGRRGGQALSRSSEIFRKHPGKVFGNLVAAGLCVLAAGGLAAFLVSLGFALSRAPVPVSVFAAELVAGLAGVWGTAFALLLFKDLAAIVPAAAG